MELLLQPETLFTLLTLTGLEIILGVDNVVFIALLVQKLPATKRKMGRSFGLGLALVLRVIMLFGATTVAKMQTPLFAIASLEISGRDILLFLGGLFLLLKGVKELLEMKEEAGAEPGIATKAKGFLSIVMQIVFIDFVLSFDSVITAVGITTDLTVIVLAVVISMVIMLFSVQPIGKFIETHPSIRVIAISFVMLVGAYLVASGLHYHIDKSCLYTAIFFSLAVEILNIRLVRPKPTKRKS
jgi:predicted tellurium resistance membrane protein TerC